jgi:2',3'-cyclic-nucleotide 2'-phosphodiesterase (5'-nucleotidase family)
MTLTSVMLIFLLMSSTVSAQSGHSQSSWSSSYPSSNSNSTGGSTTTTTTTTTSSSSSRVQPPTNIIAVSAPNNDDDNGNVNHLNNNIRNCLGGVTVDPDLQFGDINVVIITDLHTWLGGHSRQQPYNDVDMGHVLSFYERLKTWSLENDQDLWFVNNGDFVHGTGLHRIVDGDDDPSYLIPLLEKIPYDAVNCGNHELYSSSNVQYMTRPGGYVDWWGDKYITSNIVRRDGVTPLSVGQGPGKGRFKILEGKHSRLLVFGFLYNMGDDATDEVIVRNVEDVVQESWFHDAVRNERYDAILVLAHMDLTDNLVGVIQSSIRKLIGQGTPVVFVTGHTHYRGVKQLEDLTMTMEAGRYLDTVGFVSFPGKESVRSANSSSLFHHKFIDTNQKVLFQDTLGSKVSTEQIMTPNGKQLSDFIATTRKQMGLDEVVGCAPHPFFFEKPLDEPDSLWGLYRDQVIPKIFMGSHRQAVLTKDGDNEMAMLVSSDGFRYDLYANASLTVDDIVAVAPFNDTIIYLGQFPSFSILKVNETLNSGSQDPQRPPAFVLIGDILYEEEMAKQHKLYHLYTHEFDVKRVEQVLKDISGKSTTPFKTEYQSTMTLIAYATEYWPCNDDSHSSGGKLPDWFPTKQIIKKSQGKNTQEILVVLTVIAMIGLLVLCLSFAFHVFYKQTWQPMIVIQDEIVSFDTKGYHDDDDGDNYKDGVMMTTRNKSYLGTEDTELGDGGHATYTRPYITGRQ